VVPCVAVVAAEAALVEEVPAGTPQGAAATGSSSISSSTEPGGSSTVPGGLAWGGATPGVPEVGSAALGNTAAAAPSAQQQLVSSAAAVEAPAATTGGRIYVADKSLRAPSSVTGVTSSSVMGDARSTGLPPHAVQGAAHAAAPQQHPGLLTASGSAAAAAAVTVNQLQQAPPAAASPGVGFGGAGAQLEGLPLQQQQQQQQQQAPLASPPGLSPPAAAPCVVPQLQSALGTFLSCLGVSRDLALVYLTRNQADSGAGLTQQAVHLEEVVQGRGVLHLTWHPVNT
jgi:hypothetical protein